MLHFLSPEEALTSDDPPMSIPPSRLLKEFFSSNPEPTEDMVKYIAKSTLLPVNEVDIWLSHLQTVDNNRKRGAAKAAETRRLKRKPVRDSVSQQVTTDATYCCGVCYGIYEEETDEVETWISCEHCDAWFHATCLGLQLDPSNPEEYICDTCSVK